MKTLKLTFLFVFFIICFGNAQTYFFWKGGSGLFTNPLNWEGDILPTSGDDAYIVFDTGDIITVSEVPSNFTLGGMEIRIDPDNTNPTRVSFIPQSAITFDTIHNILVESGCLMDFSSDMFDLCTANAEIYGEVSFNNSSHKLHSEINDGITRINFYPGSSFIAGEFLSGYPFGETNAFSVMFHDGSVYQHHGGDSPFGLEGNLTDPVTEFSKESDFEIYNNNLLQFSGRKYGNIIVKIPSGVQYFASVAVTDISFQFTDLVIETGRFDFIGEYFDNIIIIGDTINSEGGEIFLQGGDGGISFSNSDNPVIIMGGNAVSFKIFSSLNLDINFVDIDTELVLETNIELDAETGSEINYWIYGTIDCKDKIISFINDTEVVITGGSVLKTALPAGVLGSVSNIYILPDAKIVYNGIADQVTGLTGLTYNLHFSDIENNNTNSVILDNEVEVKTLTLNSGNFHINDQTLRITGTINYQDGILLGDLLNSRLEIVETDGTMNNFYLKTPLSLSGFVISITGDVFLTESDLLFVNDSLDLTAGRLNINNSNLRLGENIAITSLFDENSYIIAEDIGSVNKTFLPGNLMKIPIGTSLNHSMLLINPVSSVNYSLKTFDHVYSGGYSGFIYDEEILDMTWSIHSESGTDTQAEITIFWDDTSPIILPGFDNTNAFMSRFDLNEQMWDNPGLAVPVITGAVSRTTELTGLFCVSSSVINNAPQASYQELTVSRDSPNDTPLGKLVARDPDDGQILSFYVLENHTNPDAFEFSTDGNVTVRNTDLLNDANDSLFYTVDVCDDSDEPICSQFSLAIILTGGQNELMISNYISPNNDNFNDTWMIGGLDFTSIDVFIYNNFGNLVYESKGYKNDWDGRSKGRLLPPGVYYYIVKTLRSEYKGTITLVR